MLSALHKNLEIMQSGKAQVQEVGGHTAEHQKQIRTSNVNEPSQISPNEVLQSWLIYTVYHILVENNKIKGKRSLK